MFYNTAQRWNELELLDLPQCGRCAFRGRRPENVSGFHAITHHVHAHPFLIVLGVMEWEPHIFLGSSKMSEHA